MSTQTNRKQDFLFTIMEYPGDSVCSVTGELTVYTDSGVHRKNFHYGLSRGEWPRVLGITAYETRQALDMMCKIVTVQANEYRKQLAKLTDSH